MKRIILILIILSTLLTSGCWDMIEIEDRIFPYSLGVDISPSESEKFSITFVYPNVAAIGKNATSDQRTYSINQTGNSIFEAEHKFTAEVQQMLYLKLLKVLVLSEEVGKDEKAVMQIIDGLNRDFIISKNARMLVVRSTARELIESLTKAKRQVAIEGTLNAMLLNKQNSTLFTPIKFTDFIEHIDVNGATIVPVATLEGEEVIIEGGAVFKGYKLIGYISPIENKALAYLNNDVKQDGIDVEYNGADLALMITNADAKKKLIRSEGNIKIRYDVILEGHIHGYTLEKGFQISTEEVLNGMQNAAASSLQKDIDKAVEKIQKDLGADVIFVADYLRKFHPKLWMEVEKDWDKIFPGIDIEVNVKLSIRRKGLTK